MKPRGWIVTALGISGFVIILVGVLQFVVFSLVARYTYVSVTFDPVVWASQQCHMQVPNGRSLTPEESRCFDAHEANAVAEVVAPTLQVGRRMVRWSLLPLGLGFGLLLGPGLTTYGLRLRRARFGAGPAPRQSMSAS